jgi:hypothetical protein
MIRLQAQRILDHYDVPFRRDKMTHELCEFNRTVLKRLKS